LYSTNRRLKLYGLQAHKLKRYYVLHKHTNSKGITYYLHSTEVTLRGGKLQTIYFFAKVEKNAKGQPVDLPADRIVKENPRNGFLTVSKKK